MQILPELDADFNIYFLSEQAITIEFGLEISEGLLQQISNLNKLLQQKPFPGFCTAVPAYTTLSVFFDPLRVSLSKDLQGADCFEKVSGYIHQLKKEPVKEALKSGAVIIIPVCYGGAFGPDLEEVAQLHQLTTQEVIALHSAAVYKVYMIGFVPGFAYLGGMNEMLATPRKATPRKVIPAGAVGIAGKQTGIYPLATPGGWQLIGQTPLKLFDAERPQPALLKAGDQVIFKTVTAQEFQEVLSKK